MAVCDDVLARVGSADEPELRQVADRARAMKAELA
jgi:hypothetical protein